MGVAPRVCVVGLGRVGRLHRRLLQEIGAEVVCVDPLSTDTRWRQIEDVPATTVDVWLICSPTSEHMSCLRRILDVAQDARVILEKPACVPDEVEQLTQLMRRHSTSRIVLMNQYAHALGLTELVQCYRKLADGPLDEVRIEFSKDRMDDAINGRFIDRHYGIFGYEWLHMLTCLEEVIGEQEYTRYLKSATPPLVKTAHSKLGLASGWEVSRVGRVSVELFSSTGRHDPNDAPAWSTDQLAGRGGRRRVVELRAGTDRFTLQLDPAVTADGEELPRNTHLLGVHTAERHHTWTITDSPMRSALRHYLDYLLHGIGTQPTDLRSLGRLVEASTVLSPATHANPAPAPRGVRLTQLAE